MLHRCRKSTSSKRWNDVDNHIRPLDNVGLLTFALQRLVFDGVYTSKCVESSRLRRGIDGETLRCHGVNVTTKSTFYTRCPTCGRIYHVDVYIYNHVDVYI